MRWFFVVLVIFEGIDSIFSSRGNKVCIEGNFSIRYIDVFGEEKCLFLLFRFLFRVFVIKDRLIREK